MMKKTRYLTTHEIIAIHIAMIQRYSPQEHIGIQHAHLLESAIYRPQSSVLGRDAYPELCEKATVLFESLAQNHPFHHAHK